MFSSISVCIATHERPLLLNESLNALAAQSRLPDEIVISVSLITSTTEQIVDDFKQAVPTLLVNYQKSNRKALPWHRWNGFQNSQGQIVYFMDDDITLAPNALQMLENAYFDLFARYGAEQIAGVGFCVSLDDGSEKLRRPRSFEERWLGIAKAPSGSITRGGFGVPPKSMPRDSLLEVGRLSGGGMSFRREVLAGIGLLDQLVELYDRRIGKSEDTVLCHYACEYGRLFMLTHPLIIHPSDARAVRTGIAINGWNKGWMETWGRAHTMRWMATDRKALRREWLRVATLEILRSLWWGILRKPLSLESWTRLAGAITGFGWTLISWGQIPSSAKLE